VVAGKDKPPTAGVIGYDSNLERERLQFKIREYMDQKTKEEKDAKERRAREEKKPKSADLKKREQLKNKEELMKLKCENRK